MRVGLVGLGKLGTAMGHRLVTSGLDVVAWNRTPKPDDALVVLAGRQVRTLDEVARRSDTIVTVVFDDEALRAVTAGLIGAGMTDKLLIQMSTVHPRTTLAVAQEMRAAGAAFVDAPVSGTVGPAREGQLLVLAGAAPEDLARAAPVLDLLGKRTAHMGEVGKGSLMKLVVNQMLGMYWEALAESLALGRVGGLDVGPMLDAILATSVGVPMLQAKRAFIEGRGGPPAFDLAGLRKDALLAEEVARELGLATPGAAATAAMVAAASAAGFATRDVAELTRYWLDRMTGLAPEA